MLDEIKRGEDASEIFIQTTHELARALLNLDDVQVYTPDGCRPRLTFLPSVTEGEPRRCVVYPSRLKPAKRICPMRVRLEKTPGRGWVLGFDRLYAGEWVEVCVALDKEVDGEGLFQSFLKMGVPTVNYGLEAGWIGDGE